MEVRAELKYTKSHEWVKEEGGVWTIGLTDYAQSALGDLVFVNLPEGFLGNTHWRFPFLSIVTIVDLNASSSCESLSKS